ncbi:MAG: hypothetical protein GC201_13635 [Alphaproteobacteria bacterium]|nr:hypothetical protein [Alphaproteobacteria bacterium]
MRNGFAGLLAAAIVALPMGALAKDDCQTSSGWKPTTNESFNRVKVQITVTNKTPNLVAATFTWKDTAGNVQTAPIKFMLQDQTVRNTVDVKGADGTADFTTDFGNLGTATFRLKLKNGHESQFKPGGFSGWVTCDRNFGNNKNIWEIDYVLGPAMKPTQK